MAATASTTATTGGTVSLVSEAAATGEANQSSQNPALHNQEEETARCDICSACQQESDGVFLVRCGYQSRTPDADSPCGLTTAGLRCTTQYHKQRDLSCYS